MDLKQIKELMAAMEKAGIKKIKIKEEKGFEVELERQEEQNISGPVIVSPSYPKAEIPSTLTQGYFPPPPPRHPPEETEKSHKEKKKEEIQGKYVNSPMVGTFYVSASPDDPAFVKVGDAVEEETILCIIEAMKVMNEVKSGVRGVVAEILISNAHPVEFGTKLFRIV